MSLLLEALKRAEKAKDDAQRRAKGEPTADDLRLEEDAPAEEGGKHVMTRDELPDISAPLEIVSDDLSVRSPAPAEPVPAPDPAPRPAQRDAGTRGNAAAGPQDSDRASARKVFEAKKFREPNPKLPFYITLGFLGAFAVGTVVYFWYQLRPPPSLVNTSPQRPADEKVVAQAPAAPVAAAPSQTAAPAAPAAPSVPGLPGAAPAPPAQAPVDTAKPPATQPASAPVAAAQAAARTTPAAAAPAKPAAGAPAPRAPAPPEARPAEPVRSFARAPGRSTDLTIRAPQARIHPRVAAGYAAYQSGDLAAARTAYAAALAEESDNRDALLGMAALELKAGRVQDAEALYRRVLKADPRDAHAQAGLIALQAPLLDPVLVESRVKSLIASNPDATVLNFALGNQYAQQARWPEAQQAYFKALAADPENPDFAFNLAVSLDHMRQTAAALRYYRSALTLAEKRSANFDPAAIRSRVQVLER